MDIHRQYAEAAADQGLYMTPSNSIQQHRARLLTLGIRLDSSRNLPVRVGAIENVFRLDATLPRPNCGKSAERTCGRTAKR